MSRKTLPLVPLILVAVMLMATAVTLVRKPVRHADVATRPITYRVDVNHADADTLCLLPGVGPGIARRIIAHRETVGPFQSPDQLEDVPLIGNKTRRAIEPWVSFQ